MKIVGKVIEISDVQRGTSKTGKEWTNQSIVVEFTEQGKEEAYVKHISISFFKTELLENLDVGNNVAVECNVESRKYNDKWFTNVSGWKIDVEHLMPESDSENDLPF